MEEAEEEEEDEEGEKTAKELDDEIKRKKERQIFLDDVGVLVAMVAITLLAIVVVTIKVVIFQPTVTAHQPLVFILILRKKIHWLALNR